MEVTAATNPTGLRSFPAPSLLNPSIPATCFLCCPARPKQSLFLDNNDPIRGGTRCKRGRGYPELKLRSEGKNKRTEGVRMSAVEIKPCVTLMKKASDLSSALKGASLFIVGMKCTLKTSVAEVLADALKYYHFDSDSLVAQAAGGEIDAESLREADESGFRDSETEVLKQLSSMGRLVVSAGNGAVQSATNLSYLRYGISVWLDVPLNVLTDDVTTKSMTSQTTAAQNPSSADDSSYLEVQDELTQRYEELRKGYANADATVSLERLAIQLGYNDDLNAVTSEELALEVLQQLEKLIRAKKMMEEAAKPF